jgi:outer membrane protein OmpA-like peptidoglycan-associated protein
MTFTSLFHVSAWPRWGLFVLLLLCGLPSHAQPGAGRVALLIGNANYAVGALRNPARDVQTMEEALRAVGFKTQVLLDANQNQMKRAVRDFGRLAEGADVAFLYYSGHGTQASGENYLIPLQAVIDKESDYEVEAVSANSLMRQIAGARPRAAVVVLDACRDNPLGAITKSATKGLGRMDVPTGTLVAFATAPNDTAADTGLYAQMLAAQLRRPGVELLDVFRATTTEVRKATGGRQVPRVSDVSIEDRIYLAGVPQTVVASVVPEAVQPTQRPGGAGGVSLEDLQREDATRREWAQWQASMRADYDKIAAFTGGADLQLRAWERFLAAWPQDNPYTRDDDELRRLAAAAASRLRTPPAATAAPALEKVTFSTDVFFYYDSVAMPPDAISKLEELAAKARSINLEVIIAVGHSDSTGTAALAQQASERRAEAVKPTLVALGVEARRIYTEGKGSSQPVADNKTAEGRAKNRRVELEVVGTRPVAPRP